MPRPWKTNELLVGMGATVEPSTIPGGTTGQVLTQGTTGGLPGFATPATVTHTVPFAMFFGTAVAAGSNPTFLGRDEDATELNVQYRASVTGTIVRMDSQASVVPGAAQTYVYTLRVAGADTAITHTNTGTNAADRIGFSTGSVAVVAGNPVSVKLVTSAGAGVANHQVMVAIQVTT